MKKITLIPTLAVALFLGCVSDSSEDEKELSSTTTESSETKDSSSSDKENSSSTTQSSSEKTSSSSTEKPNSSSVLASSSSVVISSSSSKNDDVKEPVSSSSIETSSSSEIVIIDPNSSSSESSSSEIIVEPISSSSESSSSSLAGLTMTDNDGHVYETVEIGSLVWTTENLYTSTIAGYMINGQQPTASPGWGYSNAGYIYNDVNGDGRNDHFYNWKAANIPGICPAPFRVPTKADFDNLMSEVSGDALLLKSNTSWNTVALVDGATGYDALALGYGSNTMAVLQQAGQGAYYWTTDVVPSDTTKAYSFAVFDPTLGLNPLMSINEHAKAFGFSIRCVTDLPVLSEK